MLIRNSKAQFIFLYALIFTLVPLLFRNIIPYDMIENLYWGKEWQLGYEKHPPLFAWISFWFFRWCGFIPESMYLLTQLNLLLGCVFIYKIARLLEQDKNAAFSAVFFFLSSVAACFGNTKFNATTILFSLLSIVFFFFIRMIKFKKKSDAVLLGIFAMLACIGKYIALLFLGCMGMFLLCDPECRKLLKTPLPYIALGVFLISISWHVVWLYQNDFICLRYGLDKSVNAATKHIYALYFIIMLTVFFGTSVIALFRSSKTHRLFDKNIAFSIGNPNIKKHYFRYTMEERFVIMITITPMLTMFLISLIMGMRIGSFWGANMCMLIGVYFNILNKDVNHEKVFGFTKKITVFFCVVMAIQLGIGGEIWKHYDPSHAINARKIASCIEHPEGDSVLSGGTVNFGHFDLLPIAPSRKRSNPYYRFGDRELWSKKKIDFLHADKATSFLHAYLKSSPSLYDVKRFGQNKVFDEYDKPGVHLVTFLAKPHEIEHFIEKYDKKIKSSGAQYVIDGYFVYYAFIDVK